ncbi:hypothetical protein [Anaerocolumna sp. MB42-C2]|uniref:hypothetical protein n=1 Tax=Anaerocolumna sp. MB42-C2 TaxID=3070997 RepID=UPI0027DF172C|nr:hypothetical protein [Anaerocolumna sp. MB42-C2]WMJ90334.1 hypothetical protein RBU59_12620 [Anaerocolumna sp. MB42-C2]
MKKICIIIAFILCLGLVGCSTSKNDSSDVAVNSDEVKKMEQKITDLEKENEDLKAQIKELKDTETAVKDNQTEATTSESTETESNTSIKEIKEGDTISTDRMKIKIKKIELTYDVLPDDTSGFYTHYAADSGQVYIHVDTDVKNKQKQDLACDDIMTIQADYNDGFTYDSFTVPEDSSTGFTYSNITTIQPLQTMGIRFLIDCPKEVEEENNPLSLIFTVDDKKYKYILRK